MAVETFYCLGAATFKFSVLCLYLRLFGSSRKFAILCWATGLVTFVYSLIAVLMTIFQCSPMRKQWDMTVSGHCLNTTVAAIIPGAINAGTDLVVVLLPIPFVWNLPMQKKWRIQIVGIFLLSGL